MLNPARLGLTLPDETLPERLETAIATAGHCPEPWLDSGLGPLLTRAGKRLRPALVFAAAGCGTAMDLAKAVSCAAAVELIHLSSLVHDDLMDDADSRGGVQTLHVSMGLEAAVLGGDHLMAAGGRLASAVSAAAADTCLEAYADMCTGQARETANRFRTDVTVDGYLHAVNGKTAAVMRASCKLGGLCGGLPDTQVDALARFGESLGMLFQLVDDLMDVVSTEQLWSKPVEHDLANGVYTVCVLAAIRQQPVRMRALLGPGMTPEQVSEAYALARQYGVPTAMDLIERYLREADRAMAALPSSPARSQLAALPRRYVTNVLERLVDPRYRTLLAAASAAATRPGPADSVGVLV
ncbi:polyprenyl synthetase family protein [Streptomyces phyllanthi]|uniref:Polyprenyl synthetase family protein n=1 Tax=Streptomyces phyllanthi TaxID=1803180 RepID=A0A5N8W0C8_9ACTN|nr:polyprenyl synthetase family protein [Streptomyces phyllanthi]MPY40957.1 polyprenyl synthetase family protein [Streptomyces phyllanthi]